MALDPSKLAAFAKNEVAEGHDEEEMAEVEKALLDEDDEESDEEDEEEIDDSVLVAEVVAEMEETGGDDEILDLVMGYDPELDGNPPAWVEDEDLWERAKAAVNPEAEDAPYSDPWAVVAHVYKKMSGGIKAE